jgi:hypothetical protein
LQPLARGLQSLPRGSEHAKWSSDLAHEVSNLSLVVSNLFLVISNLCLVISNLSLVAAMAASGDARGVHVRNILIREFLMLSCGEEKISKIALHAASDGSISQ